MRSGGRSTLSSVSTRTRDGAGENRDVPGGVSDTSHDREAVSYTSYRGLPVRGSSPGPSQPAHSAANQTAPQAQVGAPGVLRADHRARVVLRWLTGPRSTRRTCTARAAGEATGQRLSLPSWQPTRT